MDVNMEEWRGRGRPKKRWIDSVKLYMREMAVNDKITSDRGKWWKRTPPTPNKLRKGQEKEEEGRL
jgi:hypothetical protein